MIENPCERCENRDLCPVYRGEHCLLVRERLESAAEEYGITIQGIGYWLRTGRTPRGEECRYIRTPEPKYKISSVTYEHTVIYDGVEYPSIKEACKVAHCSANTMGAWLRRGFSPYGIECRFKDDKTAHEYVDLKSANNGRKRKVEVEGVVYGSIVEASKATGIKAKDLSYYLLHAKRPPVKCRYVDRS